MVCFNGAGYFEVDNLDFIGDTGDPAVLDALLETAREQAPGFLGFRFDFVPDSTGTGARLQAAAERLGLACYEEWDLPAPLLDLAGQPEAALAATQRKHALRHERFFRREGTLEVTHLRAGSAIWPHLEEFFQQHIARWEGTASPSPFREEKRRRLYERLTQVAGDTGWLRFTRVDWNGHPIAFHYGFCYRGRYFWNIPSFAIDLARRSPGQVLLRQLLLAAIEGGAPSTSGPWTLSSRFGLRPMLPGSAGGVSIPPRAAGVR